MCLVRFGAVRGPDPWTAERRGMGMACGASRGDIQPQLNRIRQWRWPSKTIYHPRCRMLCEVFLGEESQPQRWCAFHDLFLVVITGSGFSALSLSCMWCVGANFIAVALHWAIRQYERWRQFYVHWTCFVARKMIPTVNSACGDNDRNVDYCIHVFSYI